MASPVAQALHAGTLGDRVGDAVLDLMPPGPARGMLQALGPESAVVLPLPARTARSASSRSTRTRAGT